ncbi:hypothetical protein [Nonlabens tegetincola]|uniref:hypothetical protein n=1 Tax=Nonlabens tegetincola TaxID=323273 RepID=UPI000CF4A15B|nr:hypothetical protein [Nonlabens tegetincola]PQJ17063.1 hypothetical protein BST93_10360 [Nonlabens tegetincola]
MKKKLLLILLLVYSSSIIHAQNEEKSLQIKKTIQASYSTKRTAEMPRDSAFTNDFLERYDIYGDDEKIIEYGQYDGKGTIYEISKIQKNENGKPVKGLTFDSKGNLKKYYTTMIDSTGNVTEFNSYNSKDELVYIQLNEYDADGNVTKRISKNPNSDKVYKTELIYNSDNEVIKQINYNSDGTVKDTRTYKYDHNGNEIESELERANGDYTKFVSEYDNMNNLLVQNWYDREGIKKHQTSFIYVYDNQGNWITKKRFSNGELSYVWERKIEYKM